MPVSVQQNLIYINVKDKGAVGDGVADDTTPITNAINTANAAGGGVVYLPAGTYITSGLTLASFVILCGAGVGATSIKLKNGANADLLSAQTSSINLSSPSNAGIAGGIEKWGLRDITLDGNKANQSGGPSWCLRVYGFNFTLRDVEIARGYSGGWLNDWNAFSYISQPSGEMEAMTDSVKIHNCGGIGLEYGGPHDSRFMNVLSFQNDSHNYHIGPNSSGTLFVNCHGYLNSNNGTADWLVEGGSSFVNCIAEGSYTANVVLLWPTCMWTGGRVYGQPGNFTNVVGIQLGQAGTTTTLKSAATSSPITLTTSPTGACALSFVVTGSSAGGVISVSGVDHNSSAQTDTLTASGDGTYTTTHVYTGTPTITYTGLTNASINVIGYGPVLLKSAAVASPIVLTNATNLQGPMGAYIEFVITGAAAGGTISVSGTSVTGGAINDTLSPGGNGSFTTSNAYVGTPTITYTGLGSASINVYGLGRAYASSTNQVNGFCLPVLTSGVEVMTTISECRGGAVSFVNEAANSLFINAFQTVGSAFIGTPAAGTNFWLYINGLTADGTLGKGGGVKFVSNASNALRMTDGTQDLFNLNTNAKFMQLPNGMAFREYSDAYVTRGVEISNGTISYQHSSTAAVTATSGTITTAGVGIARVAPTTNITGVILQAGTRQGQSCAVSNESNFSVQFATSSSNVASAASVIVGPNSGCLFMWDSSTSLWMPQGPQPQPPLILTSEILMSGGGSAVMTANTVYVYQYVLQTTVTATNMRWMVGATATGNTDAGIYDSTGTLIARTGSTANTASTCMNIAFSDGNHVLAPGRYYIVMSPGNSTDTFERVSGLITAGSPMIPIFTATNGSTGTTSPVLPNTLVALSLSGKCPFVAVAIVGGI